MRVFKGRKSTGVRGIRLIGEDRVVSMSIIRHFDATSDERAAYLKMRRAIAGMVDEDGSSDEEGVSENATISQERYAEMSAAENLILTITKGGSGKMSSSHDYPVRGRGGMGVAAMDKAMRGGEIVASFPVEMQDQIMLVTSRGNPFVSLWTAFHSARVLQVACVCLTLERMKRSFLLLGSQIKVRKTQT